MKHFYLFVLLFLCTFTACHHVFAAPLTLAQNGHSNYTIVLPNNAIPAEKTAAQQLQKYFLQMTSAQIPIKTESETAQNAPQILVGNGARAKVLLPQANWNNLGKDSILIQTAGKNLILAGSRPRGSLYAVFEFLENAGCRFWWPGAYEIPHKSTFTIEPQKYFYTPPFAYRQNSSHVTYTNEEYATILRQNGNRQPQTVDWGGHYRILGWVHTFSQLLPVQKYFSQHPEWYSDPANGYKPATKSSKTPSPQATDLCLGNPQVQDAVTNQALAWIKKNPDAGYISISQNDNAGSYCRDDYAVNLIEKEGSPSAPLLKFVNKVAERIHKIYPDFIVETLAYHYSEKPPKTIRPAQNVLIRLAPISADYGHPINSDQNAKARDNLLMWEKVAPELFIWNYTTNFANSLLPHPNIKTIGDDLRFFAAHHVTGIFEQANSFTNDVGDFQPLRVYLTGKLMWNPSLDQKALTNEFLRRYYGAAAPYLTQYLQLIESAFPRNTQKLSTFNGDYSFLTIDVMNHATQLFDEAASAVKNDKTLSERVAKERFSLNLAWMMRYNALKLAATQTHSEFLGPDDPQKTLVSMEENTKRWGIVNYGEHRSIEKFFALLKANAQPPQPLPAFLTDVDPTDVIDIQPGQFDNSSRYVSLANDPTASGSTAARTDSAHDGWSFKTWQGQAVGNELLKGYSWKVLAVVRVEMKPDAPQTGTALSCGIYDYTNRKSVHAAQIPLRQLADGHYQSLELGSAALDSGMYVYVGPVDNPNIENIYLDRILLVRNRTK